MARPTLKKEIASFFAYRDSAALIAGFMDGGTGSDILVASTSLKIELTLNELKNLEQRN